MALLVPGQPRWRHSRTSLRSRSMAPASRRSLPAERQAPLVGDVLAHGQWLVGRAATVHNFVLGLSCDGLPVPDRLGVGASQYGLSMDVFLRSCHGHPGSIRPSRVAQLYVLATW